MSMKMSPQFSARLKTAIEALQNGELVILIDSEDRENEGDLVLAAQFATAEKINFLIRQACGLVCLSLEAEHVDRLGLPPMVQNNGTPRKTAFTVSIEAAVGVSTGISPQDRAHTIRVASDPKATRADIVSPGHIFPLRAAPGGVIERAGHTEGSIELCKLAGLLPAAVICEIINEDGSMARKPDLDQFSKKFNIPMCTIEELIAYRTMNEKWMKPSHQAKFPSRYSSLQASVPAQGLSIQSFKNVFTGDEHAVIATQSFGEIPLVRIHSECLTGDALGSLRCDCGLQLETSIQKITHDAQGGAVVYLKNQEGRGIGLWNKIEAYALQDQGKDTIEANLELGFHPDLRHYHEAAKMLLELGLRKIRLLTNNPQKTAALARYGIEIVEQVSLEAPVVPENKKYLETKREKFHHSLHL
jgi:3,4-dihydroxy 2-butanone 4-phosphate synthase/GTP cyclohydrolase II